MKYCLVVIGLLAATAVFAQEPPVEYFRKKSPKKPVIYKNLTLPPSRPVYTLPNGNFVYALPQDNMPCIVPRPNGSMPNAARNYPLPPNSIPNPAPKIFDNVPPQKDNK